jgi:hypothetical protein
VIVHNSVDTIQILKRRGIDAELLSLDRSDVPYETFKAKIGEGVIEFPWVDIENPRVFELPQTPEEWFLKEAKCIEKAGTKVVKPPKGTKDVIDAVCGCVYNAIDIGNKRAKKLTAKII